MKQLLTIGLALVVAFGATACNKNRKKDQYAGIDGDYIGGLGTPLADRVDGANFFGSNVERGMFQPVYFGFDSYTVDGGERAKLQQIASALRGNSNTLIIAGFTDERGTEEYNRGLGERRALAVRDALVGVGVDAGRIQTVSFGKEMPADPSSNEAAWAKNRRAEFGIAR